jgi:hypothetical protein
LWRVPLLLDDLDFEEEAMFTRSSSASTSSRENALERRFIFIFFPATANLKADGKQVGLPFILR